MKRMTIVRRLILGCEKCRRHVMVQVSYDYPETAATANIKSPRLHAICFQSGLRPFLSIDLLCWGLYVEPAVGSASTGEHARASQVREMQQLLVFFNESSTTSHAKPKMYQQVFRACGNSQCCESLRVENVLAR